VTVYHCIDEFTVGTSGHKKQVIEELETALLKKVDIVFANSLLTFQNKKKIQPNCFRVPSGANIAHFSKAQTAVIHPDLVQRARPILMFAGQINEKIDVVGLADLAEQNPEWTIVLLGKRWSSADQSGIERLKKCPNAFLDGAKPFDSLPQWFAAADLCLLPYVQGEATRFRSPLKLYEYLATGLPIISTPHPEVKEFSDLISIYDISAWSDHIGQIIETESVEKRSARLDEAANHSWSVRVDFMLEKISQEMR
ncbi:MAG: glycosyltransferase, partial [Chloroflexota bacterium]